MGQGAEFALWSAGLSLASWLLIAALTYAGARWFKRSIGSLQRVLSPQSAPNETDLQWTRGHGRVCWGPVPSREGGLAELVTSASFAVDESDCDFERDGPFWRVTTSRGERMLLPVGETVVEFAAETRRDVIEDALKGTPIPPTHPVIKLLKKREAARANEPGPSNVYACAKCKSTYTKEIEAYICEQRDTLGDSPFAMAADDKRPGDCDKCGYPTKLHAGLGAGRVEDRYSVCLLQYGPPGAEKRHLEAWRKPVVSSGHGSSTEGQDDHPA